MSDKPNEQPTDQPADQPADQLAAQPKESQGGSPGRPDVTQGDGGNPGADRDTSLQAQGSAGEKQPETGKPAEAAGHGSAGKENSLGKTGRADVTGAGDDKPEAAEKEPSPGSSPAGGEGHKAGLGGEKTSFQDGSSLERQGGTTRLEHPDGGWQERGPDGTNRYEGHGVTVTAIPGGPVAIGGEASVTTNKDGDITAVAKDGTKITASPQGGLWVNSPDGSSRGIGRDGTVSIHDGKGWDITISPNGATLERDSGGTWTMSRPDGSQTTGYRDGYKVDKSPDGTVKVTEPYGLTGVRAPDSNLESKGWGAFLFPGMNSGAWDKEQPAKPDQDRAIQESPEIQRGPDTKIYTYEHGDKVQLSREDMEDALRFGLPPGTELTDFENKLLDGTAKGGHEFKILLDVERGTVGYSFGYMSGGGTEVYNRQGELVNQTQEAGLEDPGITPLDFAGAGFGLAKGLVEGAAQGIAKRFVKEEVKDGAAGLGGKLAKELADETADLGSQAAKGEAKDEAADLGSRAAREADDLAGEEANQAVPASSKPSIWKGVEDQGEAVLQTRGGLVGRTEQHHLFPQKYNEFFERAGIHIDDYVVVVDREIHKVTHGKGGFFDDFNREWGDWIDKHPGATEQQIFEQAGEMMDKYGLSLGHKLQDYTKKGSKE